MRLPPEKMAEYREKRSIGLSNILRKHGIGRSAETEKIVELSTEFKGCFKAREHIPRYSRILTVKDKRETSSCIRAFSRRLFIGSMMASLAIAAIEAHATTVRNGFSFPDQPAARGVEAAAQDAIYVNDFYPISTITGNPIPFPISGASRPLSSFFNNLTEAQAAFPYLAFNRYTVALTDQIDWCAWQSCTDYVYASTQNAANSFTASISGTTMTISGVTGPVVANQVLSLPGGTGPTSYPGIATGTRIVSGAGTTWTVDTSQTVGPVAASSLKCWISATIKCSGWYSVNRSILTRGQRIQVEGGTYPWNNVPFTSGDSIRYIGAAATLAAQSAILLFDPQNTGGTSGGLHVHDIGFEAAINGTNTLATFTALANASYINAIQIGAANSSGGTFANLLNISSCVFGMGIWDAIKTIIPIQDMDITQNYFYGVQRDCVSIAQSSIADNTTVHCAHNYYGAAGRYAILMFGGLASRMIIENEIIQPNYNTSFFENNPQWYVQGCASNVCLVSCGVSTIQNIYTEGGANFSRALWADYHLVDCNGCTIDRFTGTNLALACSGGQTNALGTFYAANKYVDITDQQNYNVGPASGAMADISIFNPYSGGNVGWLLLIGGQTLTGEKNYFRNADTIHVTVPTQSITLNDSSTFTACAYRDTAIVSLTICAASKIYLEQSRLLTNAGYYTFVNGRFGSGVNFTGNIISAPSSASIGTWAANTAYLSATQVPVTFTNNFPFRCPLTENGYIYECIVSGTSDVAEPVWPTVIGNTVVDGTVTWKCVGLSYLTSDVGSGRLDAWNFGNRTLYQAAAPATGAYKAGEKVWYTAPTAGAAPGAVCVSGGSPGTWKDMANLAP